MPFDPDELLKEKLDMMNPERFERDLFLDTISQLESSGGKNFDHPEMQHGIHEGHQAIGRFGLMPNTIKEIVNRSAREGQATEPMRSLASEPPSEIKRTLEADPEMEKYFADQLAKKVLGKQKDQEKAAYSWHQGHNLSPKQIDERDYTNSEYVKRFRKLRDRLNSK